MKAQLLTLTETTDGFATAIIARGPGSGINRWQVRLVNEAAAAEYGLREAVVDFPNALDADHLRQLAEERLAYVSNPANFQELTVRVSGHDRPLRIGQRVRVSDGELGFTTTGIITSLDVTEDAATITLGGVPANLLDVVNRREEEERRQVALGLPAPDQVDVQPTPTGIIVSARAGVASRAVGLEVHVSTVNGFTPDASTRAARGPGTRFVIDGLPIGVRQYVRVRAYDDRGNFSPFAPQVSAVPRGVGGPELVAGTIELTNAERPQAALSVKTTAGAEVLRLGNITGKPGVPPGTAYGLWGQFGSGVFIEGTPQVVYAAPIFHSAEQDLGARSAGYVHSFSVTGAERAISVPVTPVEYQKWYRLCIVTPHRLSTFRRAVGGGSTFDVLLAQWDVEVQFRPVGTNDWSPLESLYPWVAVDRLRLRIAGIANLQGGILSTERFWIEASVYVQILLVYIP